MQYYSLHFNHSKVSVQSLDETGKGHYYHGQESSAKRSLEKPIKIHKKLVYSANIVK